MASSDQQVLMSGGGSGGGGDGVEAWGESWLPSPSRSTISQVEMALLIIRVGPVIGLLFSFSLGWLRSAFILMVTWIWVPITYTGRPLAHLGSVCQSVWSGDLGKCTYILLYIYFLITFLWWLAPHNTSANVGLLSIGALPCLSNSFYKRLRAFGLTTISTSRSTYIVIKSVFTPERRVSRKHKLPNVQHPRSPTGASEDLSCCDSRIHGDICSCSDRKNEDLEVLGLSPVSNNGAEGFAKASDTKPSQQGEGNEEESLSDQSSDRPTGFLNEVFQLLFWVLQTVLHVSDWTPRLEALGEDASNIYHGMDERHVNILRKNNTKVALYTKLPWKPFSRLWGYLHNLYLPPFLRYIGLPFYAWLFSIDLTEAEEPRYGEYKNLATFFRRKLRPGIRPIDSQSILTSPADGRVLYLGQVEHGLLEQIKGVTYSMRGFFGPPRGLHLGSEELEAADAADQLRDEEYLQSLVSQPGNVMWQCIIYLAPGDYHHIHSPADWSVFARRHIPGELFSVKPDLARWLQGLFSFNERAIYTGRWQHGFFSMTAVGATNVGSIDIDFDEELNTNVTTKYERGSHSDKSFLGGNKPGLETAGVTATKGSHFGEFNLGSTLVLLFEAPQNFMFNVKPGQALRYGQAIGYVTEETC